MADRGNKSMSSAETADQRPSYASQSASRKNSPSKTEEDDDSSSPSYPKSGNISSSSSSDTDSGLECSICLQTCIHPVQLPCTHIFCFLCVKGVANQSKRCALCRQEIPPDFLNHPKLLNIEALLKEASYEEGYQWFYEGRNGWWKYDERTSQDLEEKYQKNLKAFELLIAGFLYVVDMENMVQFRRNDPTRRRRIKRDLASIAKKGVAGLKCGGDSDSNGGDRAGADGVELEGNRAPNRNSARNSCVNSAPGSGEVSPRAPNNTPQSAEGGSPAAPASPSQEDITATMARLSLSTTRGQYLPHRALEHALPPPGLIPPQLDMIPPLQEHTQSHLLDTPTSESDSDWD